MIAFSLLTTLLLDDYNWYNGRRTLAEAPIKKTSLQTTQVKNEKLSKRIVYLQLNNDDR